MCKSLLGKAHTVMAEGGIAAALGNVWTDDSWKVHFRDTMRGGKMLNNWHMAELHAQEAPDRVLELESWGALFDRTPDGRILQRDFGGHRFARLAHVGDRTGLEMIRTLQNRAVAAGIEVFMECKIIRLLAGASGAVCGALGIWRESGTFVVFSAKAVILASGGIGKVWKFTSNSWESTGDGHALALWAGAELIDMECVQFHPTGMIWPASARGLLVTEGVRGDGGILKNESGERFMFRYIPEYYAKETADTIEEADQWYDDKSFRRPPDLLPRDEVARAINAEVKAGRGTPHGGVYLDIASRRSPEYIRRRLPSMYKQFKELADVDITTQMMEIGPTCHYMMGGVRVDADTQASTLAGLYAAGEVAGGMHGANRLGGNSLSDLLVFGRRAGMAAAEYARALARPPEPDPADDRARRSRGAGVLRPRRRREPVRRPPRAAGGDAVARRHHPHRVRARTGGRDPRRARRPRPRASRSRATGSSTRPGTSRSTSRRCSPWRARRPSRRSRAARAAAATPATTTPTPTPSTSGR